MGVSFPIAVTKYPRKQLKGGFILAHGFRGFSPQSVGSVALRFVTRQKHHGRRAWHFMAARKQRATGMERDKMCP
jgi:hypothetical protein